MRNGNNDINGKSPGGRWRMSKKQKNGRSRSNLKTSKSRRPKEVTWHTWQGTWLSLLSVDTLNFLGKKKKKTIKVPGRIWTRFRRTRGKRESWQQLLIFTRLEKHVGTTGLLDNSYVCQVKRRAKHAGGSSRWEWRGRFCKWRDQERAWLQRPPLLRVWGERFSTDGGLKGRSKR